ncbi:unnamed protein product [Chironomus riparius]|uniref:Alkylglycerone-phosphate synthase n=1 Tax=Chironomus riparius TaxID=315576 RepID=A0A9N9RTC7_9DIPT|nr:unnamed protein product [Chironomus riparius]
MSSQQIENIDIKSVIPKKRQELLKWYGWGYKDSEFVIKDRTVYFTSPRYLVSSNAKLESFKNYIGSMFKIMPEHIMELPLSEARIKPIEYAEPILNDNFVNCLKNSKIDYSVDGEDRLVRSHGQTIHEIFDLRYGNVKKIPDIVLWPTSHEQVIKIVKLAYDNDVVLIVFGGGTSVSGAIHCPQDEKRSIAILDTSQMNKLLWLNKDNLTACFEAGVVGQDLERVLNEHDLTLGHEPDSIELSTLGGWVATRASGMKKNLYGNIEDLVLNIKLVTCKGVYEQKFTGAHKNIGISFDNMIFGSEGTFGVITEVEVKVRPYPKVKRYGSIVFPDFSTGIQFLREVAKRRCQPASIRLIDNDQFQFGQSLKTDEGALVNFTNELKKFLLTRVKGYNWNEIAVTTLLFEGTQDDVERHEKLIYSIAKQFYGINGGSKNGEKGYILTYVIAYIRDFALNCGIIAESFETSVPWSKCEQLCINVKLTIHEECRKHKIKYFYVSSRVTQSYDAGACVYIYFGFQFSVAGYEIESPLEMYHKIEEAARDVVLASGGSISHHHGIGKLRKKWYKQSVSPVGVDLYRAIKLDIDPKNIFACDNFLMPEDKVDFDGLTSKL